MFSRFHSPNDKLPGPDDGILATGPVGDLADALRSNLQMEGAKPSIISEHVVLTGNIRAPGALHVEGTILGDLEVASVTIGTRGAIEGHVVCRELHVRGRFKGSAACKELFVTASAQVDARIHYEEMSVQPGASLRGELRVVPFA